jgi:hypothetical protein
MVKLFLPKPAPDPYYRSRGPQYANPPWEDDVERAKRQAQGWAQRWFAPAEVVAWLKAWPEASAAVAAGFRSAGVTPEVAMTRLWYGKVNPARHPIAVRVAIKDITLDDALEQLQAAGLVGQQAS